MDHWKGVGVGEPLTVTNDLFGVLAIDKPAGQTSRDCVNLVQRLIRPCKVGHTGTLDPLATGVLLLAVGSATRLVEFANRLPKSYEADFQLGLTSDTLDTDGNVSESPGAAVIDRAAWNRELENWRGLIQQRPPNYSALKVGGQRAYKLARHGVDFQLASRQVEIYSLETLRFEHPHVTLSLQCSSGTYVRCLGADIAGRLNSGAVMSRLVRTQIGPFRLVDCVQLEHLDSREAICNYLQPVLGLLDGLTRVSLSAEQILQLQHGIPIDPPNEQFTDNLGTEPIVALDGNGRLVAVLQSQANKLRSLRVFLSPSETG